MEPVELHRPAGCGVGCRLALEAPLSGARSYIIANADTVMERPTADLLREVFPGVPARDDIVGTGSLFSTAAARRDLDWRPTHTWRHEVADAPRRA